MTPSAPKPPALAAVSASALPPASGLQPPASVDAWRAAVAEKWDWLQWLRAHDHPALARHIHNELAALLPEYQPVLVNDGRTVLTRIGNDIHENIPF